MQGSARDAAIESRELSLSMSWNFTCQHPKRHRKRPRRPQHSTFDAMSSELSWLYCSEGSEALRSYPRRLRAFVRHLGVITITPRHQLRDTSTGIVS